jgi:hypothetical protein
MKIILCFLLSIIFGIGILAQTNLEKVVETEKAFARTAAEKNTKAAFLEFSAIDGIQFAPNSVNSKEYWKDRPAAASLLAWTPEFADISSNGVLGYTTGPWEFRPNGKGDAPNGFGHYVTLWQKQTDGAFRFVLDIGISHSQVALVSNWTSPADSGKELNEGKVSAADASTQFFEMADKSGLEKAYKAFASEDLRLYREGKIPFVGKKNALAEIKKSKAKIKFAKRSIFTSAADLAYISNAYTLFAQDGKEAEKGYFLQIWKFRNGGWQIVLDLFSPLPKNQ